MVKPPEHKAQSFIADYRRCCKQTGCMLALQGTELVIVEARGPRSTMW